MSNQQNDKVQEDLIEYLNPLEDQELGGIDLRDLADFDKELIDKLVNKVLQERQIDKANKVYDFDMVK